MMGLSPPSSSSSSRSGQCPTGPQAWAKPTLWALWVRAGRGRVGWEPGVGQESAQACLRSSFPATPFSCALLPWSVLPRWGGDVRGHGETQEWPHMGAENDLPFFWKGVGVSLDSSVSPQTILAEGKLSARHLGEDKSVVPLLAPLGALVKHDS